MTDDDAFHYFDGQRWLMWNGASWEADPYRYWDGQKTMIYNGFAWVPLVTLAAPPAPARPAPPPPPGPAVPTAPIPSAATPPPGYVMVPIDSLASDDKSRTRNWELVTMTFGALLLLFVTWTMMRAFTGIGSAASGPESFVADPGSSATISAVPSPHASKTLKPSPKPTSSKPKATKTATPKPTPKKTQSKPKPKPTKTRTTVSFTVHAGSFCSDHWAYGFTSEGTLMQCKSSATDSRFRWRSA